jgi:hypothetical protein
MRTYYVQIQCFYKDSFGKVKDSFIEEGLLDQHDEYLVYRDLRGNDPEVFDSMKSFKLAFVHNVKDFDKYVDMLELK